MNTLGTTRRPIRGRSSRIGRTALLGLAVLLASGCGGSDSAPDGGGVDVPRVTLSGTIRAPDGVVIDGDVNDPNEDYAPNDDPLAPQVVPNPIAIGGFVNVPGAGDPYGRSYLTGDEDDYYQATLQAGDRISLAVGDAIAGDLDLYLYEAGSGELVDFSAGTSNLELVVAPVAGTYLVDVYAFDGASNYVLTLGADLGTATPASFTLRDPFVPDQAIVRFREAAEPDGTAAARARSLGLAPLAGSADREVLVQLDEQAIVELTALGGTRRRHTVASKAAGDSELEGRLRTLAAIKALRRRADVLSADPNYLVRHCASTNDAYFALQWHYPQLNLPLAWNLTTGDSVPDVIVAVIDTGVLLDHPDLQGQLVGGYDFVSSRSMSNDGNGIDPDPDDPGDSSSFSSSFHGTHCAGTVAARSNNGIGVAGVSWHAKVMPVRALGVGGGTLYDTLQAVRYAARLSNDSGTLPPRAADVISMSLGGGGYTSTAQAVFSEVRNRGIVVVAAAGNESTSAPQYPAAYDGVVSVSAVNVQGRLASYSNYGATIDVAAPGGDSGDFNGDGYPDGVWSTCGSDASGQIVFNYVGYTGTSMATPHVAGVAALMKAVNPDFTPDDFDAWLASGALTSDLGTPGRDDLYGWGLIDAQKAVLAASSGAGATVLTVSPTVLNLGSAATSATLTVSRIGSDESLRVLALDDDADWISVTANVVDADGLGSYTVRAARDELSDGAYAAVVTITPSAGNVISVPVNLQVRSATATTADAGLHYVLLVNAATFVAEQSYPVRASDGVYRYTLDRAVRGRRYYVVAGSDRDNDLYIDNPGEAMGAYPALEWVEVVADGDRAGLDFETALRLAIGASATDSSPPQPRPVLRRPE